MLKKTSLKNKNNQLKKTPLKSNSKGLKVHSSLRKSGNLNIVTFTTKRIPLKKTTSLQNKGTNLAKNTELKKQNDKSKAKWQEVRNQVLKRDNYKCVVCGKPATQVHHIHLRSKRKDLLYNMNNLISLCSHDHRHQSVDGLEEVNMRIAKALHMTLEELLRFAETKSEE
nr:MAG TPA: NinG recombination protein [Caudoviricetes sp.]